MSLTPSTMMPLGTRAPDFSLEDTVSFNTVTREQFTGHPLLVMFICNHCPYVQHVVDELAALGRDYEGRGVAIVAISSNDATTHPQDAPDAMSELARHHSFTFPYLYDASQDVARAYGAACTPDFFLFDQDHRCVYRGQLDDSRPGNDRPVTGRNLRDALDSVLAGTPVARDQQPSVGCNIKWRSGT